MSSEKSVIFIGSSVEGLTIADGIESNLEHDCTAHKWSNIFESGYSALENLFNELEKVDYAAFVFKPEDIVKIGKQEYLSVRDNVIFELGLFMGYLGRDRVFIVKPENHNELRLPSDLNGIGNLNYKENDNFKVSTSIASNSIRDRIRKLGKFIKEKTKNSGMKSSDLNLDNLKYYLNVLSILSENYSNKRNFGLTEIFQNSTSTSRKLVVEFLYYLAENGLAEKIKSNGKVNWNLNDAGIDFFGLK